MIVRKQEGSKTRKSTEAIQQAAEKGRKNGETMLQEAQQILQKAFEQTEKARQ